MSFHWRLPEDERQKSATEYAELKSWLRDRNPRDSSAIRHTIWLANGLTIHHSIENTTLVSAPSHSLSLPSPISITLRYDKLKCFPENLFPYCWMQILKLSSALLFITPTPLPHGTRHSCSDRRLYAVLPFGFSDAARWFMYGIIIQKNKTKHCHQFYIRTFYLNCVLREQKYVYWWTSKFVFVKIASDFHFIVSHFSHLFIDEKIKFTKNVGLELETFKLYIFSCKTWMKMSMLSYKGVKHRMNDMKMGEIGFNFVNCAVLMPFSIWMMIVIANRHYFVIS